MALPQRKDEPSRPGPVLENTSTGKVEREVSSGWRFGFWWVWILVIIGIWYVGYGWGNHGGFFRHRSANAVAQNDAAPIGDGVHILNATDKARFVGQAFEARNIPVDQAAGKAFWIGSANNSSPMLLVLPTAASDNAANSEIHAGGWVNVNGQVVKAPPAAQAKQQWNLSDADVNQLEQQGVYVQGTQVVNAPHAGTP